MRTEVNINTEMLTWAIARAGYNLHDFFAKLPNVAEWIEGTKKPTVKQLEAFSKKVHLPFGYLFLQKPPVEKLPIPYFRTNGDISKEVSVNVYDTIQLMLQRQDWLREYLKDNEFETLDFVGAYRNNFNVEQIVSNIREVLEIEDNWASKFRTWQEAMSYLVSIIEDKGIIAVFNGVVENNTSRPIDVKECRGFVLVDEYAPFMFINNADSKSAQMFTIAHELAHIWTGHSAGFDFRKLQPADDPIEILCDKIAAEFLVPKQAFEKVWQGFQDLNRYARFFKVSEIVIARRALDLGKITKSQFFRFYDDYKNRFLDKKKAQGSGGDFYATAKKRISLTFALHVNRAVKSGDLLYRDAYKLTSMKGDTFDKFFTKHLQK